jgi:hypothetical protein
MSYRDLEGQSWIASHNLVTGETIADVPIPAGPRELVSSQEGVALVPLDGHREGKVGESRLIFVDSETVLVLDGATLEVVDSVSLTR